MNKVAGKPAASSRQIFLTASIAPKDPPMAMMSRWPVTGISGWFASQGIAEGSAIGSSRTHNPAPGSASTRALVRGAEGDGILMEPEHLQGAGDWEIGDPRYRPSGRPMAGCCPIDFAPSAHTNPARMPVRPRGPLGLLISGIRRLLWAIAPSRSARSPPDPCSWQTPRTRRSTGDVAAAMVQTQNGNQDSLARTRQ
jgi:hypothetical protein